MPSACSVWHFQADILSFTPGPTFPLREALQRKLITPPSNQTPQKLCKNSSALMATSLTCMAGWCQRVAIEM